MGRSILTYLYMQQLQRLLSPMLYVLQLSDMLSLTLWLYRVLPAPQLVSMRDTMCGGVGAQTS